ncbi:Ail/Lom family outer membrane beta-barrel protein [Erwinia sp. ErVv1]|uniref:Ail/Lom family outer membrane beta-barrel protein n=1 Tax=Erwinia sp. ErVv1 TaxID=1603299 RepID=UPI00082AB386|nr:Ail/Lom family outer membrane beta-barrel protein [Erwinia sp. ErVv1]
MKKTTGLTVLIAGLIMSATAMADSHSISVGYAQSKVQNFKNMPGVNLQYRYEWDSPVSLLTSFTALQNDEDESGNFMGIKTNDHVKAEYYSLMVGPAWRLNDYISLYALAGLSHSTMERNARDYDYYGHPERINFSDRSNAFAYGAGVIFNVTEHVTLNAGYEGSRTSVEAQKRSVNGVNVVMGYRF